MSEKPKLYDTMSEEQKAVSIPYFVHEGEMTRMERLNRRWFIAFLTVLIMLFVTNAGWVIYENQFETYTYEIRQDSGEGGNNTYTGNTVGMAGGDLNGTTGDPDHGTQTR